MTKAQNAFFITTFSVLTLGTIWMNVASAEPNYHSTVEHFHHKVSEVVVPDAVVQPEKLHQSANLSYKVAGKRYYPEKEITHFSQEGRASWYGGGFHGRKTSNGDRYDMNMMTAAHKTLPIPSYAKVTNLENGKSVIVRINDRGPFHSNRIIDVSKAAASKLGFINQGVTNVRVEQIVPGNEMLASSTDKASKQIYVNLKSFKQKTDAQDYLKKISQHLKGVKSNQKIVMVKQNNQYLVQMGPFNNQENADRIKQQTQTTI